MCSTAFQSPLNLVSTSFKKCVCPLAVCGILQAQTDWLTNSMHTCTHACMHARAHTHTPHTINFFHCAALIEEYFTLIDNGYSKSTASVCFCITHCFPLSWLVDFLYNLFVTSSSVIWDLIGIIEIKSKYIRVVNYTSRCTSGYLILNSACNAVYWLNWGSNVHCNICRCSRSL